MVIERYNVAWPELFESIRMVFKSRLTEYESIEHIGSTSIPGMYAKPIIDIDIVIHDSEKFDITMKELLSLGYFHAGSQGILGREVFKRSADMHDPTLDTINHHLYVCDRQNEELKRHIVFRDALRSDATLRDRYNSIKLEIMGRVGHNRKAYVEMKENEYAWFFDSVIKKHID